MAANDCAVCDFEKDTGRKVDTSKSPTAWGEEVGVHRTTITRHIGHAPNVPAADPLTDEPIEAAYKWEQGQDDFVGNSPASEVPLGESDVDKFIRGKGIDPADWDAQWRFSEWEAQKKGGAIVTLHAFRVAGKRKVAGVEKIDWSAASAIVDGFTYIPAKRDFLIDSAILQPTDEQWGKTDFEGGTPETEERVLNSYAKFADYVKEYRPSRVLFARTGDGIENTCSTGSQRDTNDLDVPHMLVQSYKMDLTSLKMIAPLVEQVIDARVPSNHGRWRTGLKADAGNPHADFGIGVGKQLQETQRILEVLPNVEFAFPDALMESMLVQLGDLRVGLVHGHQANRPEGLAGWWEKQDHGRMPTWDADLLMCGHFHSFRIEQSGDGRWLMVGPASDPGSSWYSNVKGVRSTAGMLAMAVEGKKWRFPEVL